MLNAPKSRNGAAAAKNVNSEQMLQNSKMHMTFGPLEADVVDKQLRLIESAKAER